MRKAKVFFYVSLGVLALAVAFHLGARNAQGQGVGTIAGVVGFANARDGGNLVVITESGDMWGWEGGSSPGYRSHFIGNIFSDSPPVRTEPTTWGRIKAQRR